MTETSPLYALPLLQAGQAQKEIYHNEALLLLDALAGLAVESFGDTVPPGSPALGQSWILDAAPSGAWSGQGQKVALWTVGGWRFIAAPVGTPAWIKDEGIARRRESGGWSDGAVTATALKIGGNQVVGARRPAIPAPSGGAAVDAEARTAIGAILVALRTHGLIEV